jgi:hypothetical protein
LVAANVFGKAKTNTDFLPYNGDGFKLLVPAKWNPSKEREFPGQVLRYEDNFDATSNVSVIVQTTDKKSITDYGSPEEFLSKVKKEISTFCFFSAYTKILIKSIVYTLQLLSREFELRPLMLQDQTLSTKLAPYEKIFYYMLSASTYILRKQIYYFMSVFSHNFGFK